MRYDAAIIGSGVASASVLLALADNDLRIVVIAPDAQAEFKIGETLSPAANEELRQLGVDDTLAAEGHFKALSKFSAWGSRRLEEHHTWESRYQAGWYIDRVRFERFLWTHAQRHRFERHHARVRRADDRGNHWQIHCNTGVVVEARYVLDCSGRSAIVGRRVSERRRMDKLVATYAVFHQCCDDVEATVATLVEAAPDGWYYSTLVPGNRLVVAMFTDSDLLPDGINNTPYVWESVLQQADFTMKRIESAGFEPQGPVKTVDASTLLTTDFATPRFLAAGDAAASFDPLSSHGITTALWSGRKAATALLDLLNASDSGLNTYRNAFSSGIARYLDERNRVYAAEPRFAQRVFWQRRREASQNEPTANRVKSCDSQFPV